MTHVLALDVLQEREEKVLVEEGRDLLDVVELSHLGCLINNCYQRVAPQLPCPLSQILTSTVLVICVRSPRQSTLKSPPPQIKDQNSNLMAMAMRRFERRTP